MTDENCGAETPNGPCGNPATKDNGRCWIPSHTDPDAENPQGNDFAISEDDHEDILEAAKLGMSKSGCARAAGTGPDELRRYVESHPDFREAFMRARFQGERRLIEGPLESHEDDPIDMDSQHARFLLSTSFGYVKTEKREVDMDADVDGEMDVVVDFNDVDT